MQKISENKRKQKFVIFVSDHNLQVGYDSVTDVIIFLSKHGITMVAILTFGKRNLSRADY